MKDFLRVLSALSLIRLTADLLLPSGDSGRYVDFGVGLCMTVCMLSAMLRLIRGFL